MLESVTFEGKERPSFREVDRLHITADSDPVVGVFDAALCPLYLQTPSADPIDFQISVSKSGAK